MRGSVQPRLVASAEARQVERQVLDCMAFKICLCRCLPHSLPSPSATISRVWSGGSRTFPRTSAIDSTASMSALAPQDGGAGQPCTSVDDA
jgi:hypothetical protein